MIDVDNYHKDFTPGFDKDKFKELMQNPLTSIPFKNQNIFVGRRLFKSIVGACKLLYQQKDRNNLYFGREGSGKSHTAFQHTYIWWWVLTELKMINYPFGIHLMYGRLKDLIAAFDKYKDIKYMLFTLDESDEINRKNWNKVNVKLLMTKLRRERKNLRIVNLLMPSLEEMLPSITLSRINWIFEIEEELSPTLNLVRGNWKKLNIPVGAGYTSPMHKRFISNQEISNYLYSRLYNNEDKFGALPRKLLAYTGNTNGINVIDPTEYRKWALEINSINEEEEEENQSNEKEKKVMDQRNKTLVYLNKELGISQSIIAKITGLSVGAVAKIIQSTTTTITPK